MDMQNYLPDTPLVYFSWDGKFHCMQCGFLGLPGGVRRDDMLLSTPIEALEHLNDHRLNGERMDRADSAIQSAIHNWNTANLNVSSVSNINP